MNAAIRMAWGAALLALISGCAQPGMDRGGPHAGMSHGAVSSGTAERTDQAGCQMMERQRKAMCEGKTEEECQRAVEQHRHGMADRMKDGMKDGQARPDPGAMPMCDMMNSKP
jgi:hypothetical protein